MTPQEAAAAVRDMTAQLGGQATDYLNIRLDRAVPSAEVVVLMIYPEGMLNPTPPLYVRAASFEAAIAAMGELVAGTLRARNDDLKKCMVAELAPVQGMIDGITKNRLICAGFNPTDVSKFSREITFLAARQAFQNLTDTCGVTP